MFPMPMTLPQCSPGPKTAQHVRHVEQPLLGLLGMSKMGQALKGLWGRTWSFPQSNWMRRRSGKKTCWRTIAVRRGAERWNHSCCSDACMACCSASAEVSGRLHQISGVAALACSDSPT